jgi:Holliday junction resolvasome RuvABC endonuclease subunit
MVSLIGIDPGARGIAYTVLKEGRLITGEVVDLLQEKKYNKVSAVDISDLIMTWFENTLRPQIEFHKPKVIAIERPYRGKMILVFGFLLGVLKYYCKEKDIQVLGILPSTYKKKLELCRGDYDKNKEAVIRFMTVREKSALEEYVWADDKQKGDFADAYALSVYVAENVLKNNKKRKRDDQE